MRKESARIMKCVRFVLVVFLLIPLLSFSIFADSEVDQDHIDSEESTIEESSSTSINEHQPVFTLKTIDNLPDSVDLFEGYVNREFGIEEDQNESILHENGLIIESSDPSYKAILDLKSQKALEYLKSLVLEVADGRRASTAFQIPFSEIGITQLEYTAEELGVDSIAEDGVVSQEAEAAMRRLIDIDLSKIMIFLAADSPYELYWFDKTIGYAYYEPDSWPFIFFNGESVCFADDYIPVWMFVTSDFRGSYEMEEWMADVSLTGAASLSAANARSEIEMHKTELDFEKLTSYKEYICDAVEYNDEAASPAYEGGYGNPWQLIYVFDEDPTTNVVCEGYSKAFQYLCDLSSWHDPELSCISVTGFMGLNVEPDGPHMWNIVTLENNNYIADITNSDSGTIGNNGQLFLTGAIAGDPSNEYLFFIDDVNDLYYSYDGDTASVYDSELILSDTEFDPALERPFMDC